MTPRSGSSPVLFILLTGLLQSVMADPLPAQSRGPASATLNLTLRWQRETAPGTGRFLPVSREEQWDPAQTACIVCDVWDYHHCWNAVQRLEEFAPRLNAVLHEARRRGVTIIHAPSDCMAAYADHPARRRALAAPVAPRPRHDIAHWCSQIPAEEQAVYPIDQSDGGEDDDPADHAAWVQELTRLGRNPALPWQRQSDLIEIDPDRDFISDRGEEVWNVLESRGIRNVILAGVHVNMCVLGRPFGLRQMARNGKHVVLMRDMTDAMYNPQRWPYVSHFTGVDLIVDHIERHVCPTVTSDQFLGGRPFRFAKDLRPHLVVVIAEEPYDTKTTLPEFVQRNVARDFRVTILHADEQTPHSIPGLSAVRTADVLLLSVRRQVLPETDLQTLRDYVARGGAVVGLRTSSHAFALREGVPPPGLADWPTFDADVFGGNYHGSYPDELRSVVRRAEHAGPQEALRGLQEESFPQGGHLYKTGPLRPGARLLLEGQAAGGIAGPVAWTFARKDGGRSFYVALGHPEDFQQPDFVRLLRNAVYWAAGQQVPAEAPAIALTADDYRQRWVNVPVPATWDAGSRGVLRGVESPGWLRCVVKIPGDWLGPAPLKLVLGAGREGGAADPHGLRLAFLNGHALPASDATTYLIPAESIMADDHNLLVIRMAGPGDALREAPRLRSGDGSRQLSLAGTWQLRLGDEPAWANIPLPAKFGGGADIVFVPE